MKKNREWKPNKNQKRVLRLLPTIGKGKGKFGGLYRRQIVENLNSQTIEYVLRNNALSQQPIDKVSPEQVSNWLQTLAEHKFARPNNKKQWHQLKDGHDFLLRDIPS